MLPPGCAPGRVFLRDHGRKRRVGRTLRLCPQLSSSLPPSLPPGSLAESPGTSHSRPSFPHPMSPRSTCWCLEVVPSPREALDLGSGASACRCPPPWCPGAASPRCGPQTRALGAGGTSVISAVEGWAPSTILQDADRTVRALTPAPNTVPACYRPQAFRIR